MTEEELVESFRAVAQPVRLRILKALSGAERNVGEIDDVAQIGQPMLSQQLAVLRNAGLVKTRKDGKLVFYQLDESKFGVLSRMLDQLAGSAAGTLAGQVRRSSPGAANFARLG